MKPLFHKLLACVIAATGALTTQSCISVSDRNSHTPEIDTEAIVSQVNSAIRQEADFIQLRDTVFSMEDSVIPENGISAQPIVVKNLKVIVDTDDYSRASENYNRRVKDAQRFILLLIMIVVPALLIIILAAGFIWFAIRRGRERNEIINNAIQAGYQLPDEFYKNSSILSFRRPSHTYPKNGDTTPPPANRDRTLFNSGIKYICIGIGIILSFLVWSSPEAAVLGIIPALIGASKLISYYH